MNDFGSAADLSYIAASVIAFFLIAFLVVRMVSALRTPRCPDDDE